MKKLLKNFMGGVCLLAIACTASAQQSLPSGVTVKKIWDKAVHSAFTDLILFKGKFYCAFREGDGHIPMEGVDGTVRILTSADGEHWSDLASLETPGIDLRDPKLSVTPSGKIMVIIGGSIYEGRVLKGRIPHVSFSDANGENFSIPEKVQIDKDFVSWGDWIWRVTWHKGTGYAIDYQIGPEERKGPTALYLVKTTDGRSFSKVHKYDIDGFPNEATIRFDKKNNMHVLIRRELGDQMGIFAVAPAPYQQWDEYKINYRLGGPNFVFLNKNKRVIGTRVYGEAPYMGILTEESKGRFREVLKLPSSGDCSYPGMVVKGKFLYISYYASHEGKSAIYFSKVPLSLLK